MDIPYISVAAKELAKGFEKKFSALPSISGILFVSVKAVPVVGGKTNTFDIRLGVTRSTNPGTAEALIRHVMNDEIQSGLFQLRSVVYQGISGAARDEDPAATDSPAA